MATVVSGWEERVMEEKVVMEEMVVGVGGEGEGERRMYVDH